MLAGLVLGPIRDVHSLMSRGVTVGALYGVCRLAWLLPRCLGSGRLRNVNTKTSVRDLHGPVYECALLGCDEDLCLMRKLG